MGTFSSPYDSLGKAGPPLAKIKMRQDAARVLRKIKEAAKVKKAPPKAIVGGRRSKD